MLASSLLPPLKAWIGWHFLLDVRPGCAHAPVCTRSMYARAQSLYRVDSSIEINKDSTSLFLECTVTLAREHIGG
jgi:hypothetical protein